PGKAHGPIVARDTFVYFDNDAKVHAPFDAQRLAEQLGTSSSHGAASDHVHRRGVRRNSVTGNRSVTVSSPSRGRQGFSSANPAVCARPRQAAATRSSERANWAPEPLVRG